MELNKEKNVAINRTTCQEKSLSNILSKKLEEWYEKKFIARHEDIIGDVDIFWCDSLDDIAIEVKAYLDKNFAQAKPKNEQGRTREQIISDDFIFNESVDYCTNAQINSMSFGMMQGRMDTNIGIVYHLPHHYSGYGKPIWKITDGKIDLLGLYKHGATNKIYLKNKNCGGEGSDTIIIK